MTKLGGSEAATLHWYCKVLYYLEKMMRGSGIFGFEFDTNMAFVL